VTLLSVTNVYHRRNTELQTIFEQAQHLANSATLDECAVKQRGPNEEYNSGCQVKSIMSEWSLGSN
jgi:hypothetical protein